MTSKNQKWSDGAILELDAHGYTCRAQMLQFPEIAFFDPANSDKVIFRLWVHQSAYTKGRWLKIDRQPISRELLKQVPRFKKDTIAGSLSIYVDGQESHATAEECLNLECAAIWDPEHVEDRIRDYCENRENIWVKSLAITSGA